jgi:hypothetical protein
VRRIPAASCSRDALGVLGVSRLEDETRSLAEATQRAIISGLAPNDVAQAAVAWACQWAES